MLELPEQTVVLPLMTPGVAGTVLTVMDNDCTAEEPQVLFAVTDTFPLVVLDVAEIELVVEEPVHPLGKIHV